MLLDISELPSGTIPLELPDPTLVSVLETERDSTREAQSQTKVKIVLKIM
jgi:hypothetical protein